MLGLDHPLAAFFVALGIGLLIGTERERRKGEGPFRSAAGIRTFAITALLGAVSIEVGGGTLLSVTMAGLIGLVGLAYYRSQSDDPGLTTEIALVLTLALGGLAARDPGKAAGLAVAVAILLAARIPVHSFVRDVLSETELKSALIFAAATLIVWPVIPNRYLGPFDAINPFSVWSVVILIMAISACGYVAVRVLGARYGLPAAGLASGFASSSATIASMGDRVVQDPGLLRPAVAGAVLSTVATVAQMAVLLVATSPPTLAALWQPLAFAGLAALAYGLVFTVSAVALSSPTTSVTSGEAFSFKTALLMAATLVIVLLGAATLRAWLGDRGVAVAAALAGFADAHATTVSVASQVASGKMAAADASVPILLGFTTNSVTKILLATTSRSKAFALRVVPGLIIVLIASWAGLLTGS
ncbi:MAG: MgtC/SapB family protein [Bradyrhizobiaceae bacterium]|nr:MgtC/SapB family protein [Bradyrhizobiaceae bacterium]